MFSRSASMLARTLVCAVWCLSGAWVFGQIQVPAIDPSGNQIFLPPSNPTTLLTPGVVAPPPVSPYQTPVYPGTSPYAAPVYPQPVYPQPVYPQPVYPQVGAPVPGYPQVPPVVPGAMVPGTVVSPYAGAPQYPAPYVVPNSGMVPGPAVAPAAAAATGCCCLCPSGQCNLFSQGGCLSCFSELGKCFSNLKCSCLSGSCSLCNKSATAQAAAAPMVAPQGSLAPTPPPPNFSAPTGVFATPASGPPQPAFSHPADVPNCDGKCGGSCSSCRKLGLKAEKKHLIPKPPLKPTHGQMGQIIMTPARIVAPVGSDVIVLAGICGGDGHYVINQPLEWMLSNDSVGQIIEVGGMEHKAFNKFVPPSSKKQDGQYAEGRTGLKEKLLTRGTPTPVDDLDVAKGQTYISLSSASPGTTYLTCVAPNAQAWDKRRAQTIIHWVDGIWAIPTPIRTASGTVQPLTTSVTRVVDGTGISGWKVRYTIIGGVPAEFAPAGSQTAELQTTADGKATVQLQQTAGKVTPGTTQLRVDVIRPPVGGESELLLESALTSVTWSAPALTIKTIGPKEAALSEPFNYRIEVTNPGDQVSRNVVVSTDDIANDIQYLTSNPKPGEFGTRFEWRLGDIPPNSPPRVIDVQLKSSQRGVKRLCFEVNSADDKLKTEACGETDVAAPCLGLEINGPREARMGEQASYTIKVVNQCDAPLRNITLNVQYDPGLRAVSLGNPIVANVGDLAFGESKSIPLVFDVVAGGVQCFVLNVTAEQGHTATVKRCLDVTQSVQGAAALEVNGEPVVKAGNLTIVNATVRNTGNTPLETITILNRFSPSLSPQKASSYPPASNVGNDIAFSINRLEPGQAIPFQVQYVALQPDGNAFSQFTLTTPSGAAAEKRYDLRIEPGNNALPNQPPANNQPPAQPNQGGGGIGIPADPQGALQVLVEPLEAVPADGRTPGRVRITIRNNRQVSDKNVDLAILIPPGMRIVNLESPIPASFTNAQKNEVKIDRILEMRAGETITMTASLVADQPGQPVVEVSAASDNTLGTVNGRAALTANPAQ